MYQQLTITNVNRLFLKDQNNINKFMIKSTPNKIQEFWITWQEQSWKLDFCLKGLHILLPWVTKWIHFRGFLLTNSSLSLIFNCASLWERLDLK